MDGEGWAMAVERPEERLGTRIKEWRPGFVCEV
jgi:hypothetical protein